ncbi:MAG: LamG domain-containing protein, partial [Nanoarchaeota archaeon]|nr:LamG domain-containing protein [Nanoarchaeota archaeon]
MKNFERCKLFFVIIFLLIILCFSILEINSYSINEFSNSHYTSENIMEFFNKYYSKSIGGLTGLFHLEEDSEPSSEEPVEETISEENPEELGSEISVDEEILNETESADSESNETILNETESADSESNETILNETIDDLNETILNETLVEIGSWNTTTLQYLAVIGRPVKWIKKIDVNNSRNLTIEIPRDAENVSILTNEEVRVALEELEDYEKVVEDLSREDLSGGVLTGHVSYDILKSEGILTRFWNWLESFTISGKVISENELSEAVVETESSKIFNLNELANISNEIAIEYYTPAPEASEVDINNGKRVVVSASDGLNYTEILAYVMVDEMRIPMGENKLKLYWYPNNESDDADEDLTLDELVESLLDSEKVIGGDRILAEYVPYDFDEDGYVDYIEWIVPHLSAQTYEIIIEITSAVHLDSNRDFISDIYNETYILDDVWSEAIYSGEYVRITFEKALTEENDITVFTRNNLNNSNLTIEVYHYNSDELIVTFPYINELDYTKVYLTGMQGSQDTFDLKIVSLDNSSNSSLSFDYIVDPLPGADTSVSIEFATSTLDNGSFTAENFVEVELSISDLSFNNNVTSFIDFDGSIYDWLRMDNLTNGTNGTFGRLNGIMMGSGSYNDAGRFGRTYSGDGINGGMINITNHVSESRNWSVSFWLKRNNAGALLQYVMEKRIGTVDRVFRLYFDNSPANVLTLQTYDTTGAAQPETFTSAIADTSWHHVVFGYNGTSIYIYLDNVLEDANDFGGTGIIQNGTYPLYIGGWRLLTSAFNGSIDDVVFFNRSISADEITALFDSRYISEPVHNFSGLEEGNHTFIAFAQNSWGNLNQTETRTISVDQTPPVVNVYNSTYLISQSGSFNISDEEYFIEYNGTDNGTTSYVSLFSFMDNNYVEWFRIDENNGTDVFGYFGRLNGTISKGEIVETGYFGKGIKFTGDTSDGVDIGDYDVNPNSYFGVSLWFKKSSADITNNQVLFSRVGGVNSFYIRVNASDSASIIAYNLSGDSTEVFTGLNSVQDTNWHHLVAGFGPKTGSHEVGNDVNPYLYIYLDGVLKNNASVSGNITSGVGQIDIGKLFSNTQEFNGIIDDVIIVNKSISSEEVIGLYANQSTKFVRMEYSVQDIEDGYHNYTTYGQDLAGNIYEFSINLSHNFSLIYECGRVSHFGRTYFIQNNLSNNGDDCITVGDNNITIDLNNYNLAAEESGSGAGISNSLGNNNLKIFGGGTIRNYSKGIETSGEGTNITDLTIINISVTGISFLSGSNNSFVMNVNLTGPGTQGILFSQGNKNHVRDFNITGYSIPFYVIASNNTLVENGTIDAGTYTLLVVGNSLGNSSNNIFRNLNLTGSNNNAIYDTASNGAHNWNNSYLDIDISSSYVWDYHFSNASVSGYDFNGNS